MKSSRNTRGIVVAILLGAALTVGLIAVGCFGGGDEPEDVSTTAAGGVSATATTSVDESTTLLADADSLSTFNSKDPFIPQAQLVTTTLPPTTLAPSTTASTNTTIRVTTTLAHRLTVTDFPGGGIVTFTVDRDKFTGFGAGPALFTSATWGTIQILEVNDAAATRTARFKLNGATEFTLQEDQFKTW